MPDHADAALAKTDGLSLAQLLAFGCAYFALAFTSRLLGAGTSEFQPVWMPAGLLLGTLLLIPEKRSWRPVIAVGILADAVFHAAVATAPALATLLIACDALAGVSAAVLVQRFAGRRPALASVPELFTLVVCIVVVEVIATSAVALAASVLFGIVHSAGTWLSRMSGDALGSVLIAAIIISPRCPRRNQCVGTVIAEAVLLLCALAITLQISFLGVMLALLLTNLS